MAANSQAMPISTEQTPGARRVRREQLLRAMERARSYEAWRVAASDYDLLSGGARWKERRRSTLYDFELIESKLERLRALRRQGDAAGLLFEIEEGIHGNLGGMGKPQLHERSKLGTKLLITDYIEAVVDALQYLAAADPETISHETKLDLFDRAAHCFGRTALMMSSGGMLMFFHFGVARALFDSGLLPDVISGSSAGAIVAAVLGTRSDAELKGFLYPENIYFGRTWKANALEKLTGLRRFFTPDAFDETFARLIPDLTFREAYDRTGRHISISVSPCERHQTPRLLNALTSPHVLIRSAVRASCAVPGLFEPVQLLARNSDGRTVPFLRARWIDGVFAADLPAKQLGRLYGTNYHVVSYINPFLPFRLRDRKQGSHALGPAASFAKETARWALQHAERAIGRYLPTSSAGVITKVAHDVLSQNYTGDITITPEKRFYAPHRLASPFTYREMSDLLMAGERQTWPRLERIRLATCISRNLDSILDELRR